MNYYIGLYSPNKAKRDIDEIMESIGFKDIAFQMNENNKVARFLRKLLCVIKVLFILNKEDLLVIQYPFKKYYVILCKIAKFKGSKTITLIHDLGTFRRQKLTAEKEIKKLNHTDFIIVHNENMKIWLKEHGCKIHMGNLNIFDYLSSSKPSNTYIPKESFINIVYAGGLHKRKNAFIYNLYQVLAPCNLELYGPGELEDVYKTWNNINYHGLVDSDFFINNIRGDWGLVWDGDTIDGCGGIWGSYLKLNNPHKTSFYLRSGLPVIVWKQSAMTSFVLKNNIGIAVNSLSELSDLLPRITNNEYMQKKENVMQIAEKLNNGYYFRLALDYAITQINKT